MSPVHTRVLNNLINIDHSGRSLSPLPMRTGGNHNSMTRCRSGDPDSLRVISNCFSRDIAERKDFADVDLLLAEKLMENPLRKDNSLDCTVLPMSKDVISFPQCPTPDENIIIVSRKKSTEPKAAAAPVSIRSAIIAPLTPKALESPSSKNFSTQVSPLMCSPETAPGRAISTPHMYDSPNGLAAMSTPPSNIYGTSLRIETPSSGTPGSKRSAAAPVSVRSTNKPPEVKMTIQHYESNESSPRSQGPTPRHSTVVILGSSSKTKQQVGRTGLEYSTPPSQEKTLLKKSFFGGFVGKGKIERQINESESYNSTYSESDEGDSCRFPTFGPSNATMEQARNLLSEASFIDKYKVHDFSSSNMGSGSKLSVGGLIASRSNDTGIPDKLNRGVGSGLGGSVGSGLGGGGSGVSGGGGSGMKIQRPHELAPITPSPEGTLKKTIVTSVSSLWAFATEFSSAEKDSNEESELDKCVPVNKPNRMSAEAIAGAIARQGVKVTSPFNSSFLTSFTSPNTNIGKMTSDNLAKVVAVEGDGRKSLPTVPTRRRSSAPTMASDATSESSDVPSRGPSPPGSKRGYRQKQAERAVSLPTIPSDSRSQGHTTFISALWDLSADYSDQEREREREKDGVCGVSPRSPSPRSRNKRHPKTSL